MTNWKQLYMPDEGVPDRRIGLVAGIVGGAVGLLAMRAYWRNIAPLIFSPAATPDSPYVDRDDSISLVGQQYQEGESSTETVGRLLVEKVDGRVFDDQRATLGDDVLLAWGIIMGATYGATRTTTRNRDIAGGFFYGIRLWLGDAFIPALLGLRPSPNHFSSEQHLWRLSAIWVYSFTTTAVTRLLYRILAGSN